MGPSDALPSSAVESWKTSRDDMQSYTVDGDPVVYVYRGKEPRIPVTGDQCWPDACLIAAAPDMAEALLRLRPVVTTAGQALIDAALKKAGVLP
jgi:hypothetical protein